MPPNQRRNYSSFLNAARIIFKEEGIKSLFNGIAPTVAKGIALNLAMFTTFEQTKEVLNESFSGNSLIISLISSMFGGTAGALASLPFDNANTKMQKQMRNSDGKMPFKNLFDCITKEIGNNGIKGLYVGYPAYVVRIVPSTMITLIISEEIKKIVNNNWINL